jgi:hypothetical protein
MARTGAVQPARSRTDLGQLCRSGFPDPALAPSILFREDRSSSPVALGSLVSFGVVWVRDWP